MDVCNVAQNTVAVVHAASNQGVDEHSGVVSREHWTNGPQLTKLVKTSRSNPLHMHRKRQFGVNMVIETSDVERRCDAAVLQWNL